MRSESRSITATSITATSHGTSAAERRHDDRLVEREAHETFARGAAVLGGGRERRDVPAPLQIEAEPVRAITSSGCSSHTRLMSSTLLKPAADGTITRETPAGTSRRWSMTHKNTLDASYGVVLLGQQLGRVREELAEHRPFDDAPELGGRIGRRQRRRCRTAATTRIARPVRRIAHAGRDPGPRQNSLATTSSASKYARVKSTARCASKALHV